MYKSLFITLALLSNTVLADKSDVMDRLEPYFPNLTVEHINVSQLDGFYEVLVQEPKFDVLFISENGRYIIQGSITDLDDMTSISNKRINTLKKQIIARIPEADKIVFNANDEQYIIHVFTDPYHSMDTCASISRKYVESRFVTSCYIGTERATSTFPNIQ